MIARIGLLRATACLGLWLAGAAVGRHVHLPAADLGRATKGAAYGYEGAAQMWLGKYTEALTAFNNPEVTNNYHLLPKFVDVHEYSNQNNDESLFEIQFSAGGMSQSCADAAGSAQARG
jgi:hypothetical protein